VHHVGPATLVRGSTVLADGRLKLYDEAADPSRGFVAGNWDHITGFENRPGTSVVRADYNNMVELDEGVLLSGRCDFNHFHFLIEYLPRLHLVDRVNSLQGVPLIVTDDLNESSREALRALSGDRQLISVSRRDLVKVRSLHIPSMHTFIPDSTRFPWLQSCRYSPTLLLEMRNRLLEAFPSRGEFGRNIFLIRSSSARSLQNGEELIEVALAHGLECIDPGELSFAQQVDLFSHASLFLGVGGAAWANIIFASRGSLTLSMVSEQVQDFSMHSTMAELAGVRMMLLLGKSSQRPSEFMYRRDYHHAPFSVDPGLVDTALASVLA
jgi:capsular polysaccharide biosynthesis protein